MKHLPILQSLSIFLLLAFAASPAVGGYGGGDGGGGAGSTPAASTVTAAVTFEDPSSDTGLGGIEESMADTPADNPSDSGTPLTEEEIQALEDALAEAVRNGQIAADDLEWAEFWSDLTIGLDDTLSIGAMIGNLPAKFPISWVYMGIRRGTSRIYGWASGNQQAVDAANDKTAVNRIKNHILNHPEFIKAMEMYREVQKNKAAMDDI